ncbi:MAG: HU family DNA-binding protein [Alphaproteobacteria bacterium]|nr:HU family DNA-binding protein [Alphaproteobacteria bacterium]
MIKSELIDKIAAANNLAATDADRVISTIFDEILKTLKQGGRVELRGFGIFSVRTRRARMGRNPKTGAPVAVEAKKVPFFKAGKTMTDVLNKKPGAA